MPTISTSNVPTPKSWDEFEDITLAAAKIRWGSTDFYRHGRQGQKQDGVDVWGHTDDDRLVGIQCKNSTDGITLKLVETEVSNAEKFDPPIERLYVATTAPRDAQLQKSVRGISKQRGDSGKFRVDVLFWDDICQDIAKDDDVFFSFYPQFRAQTGTTQEHDKALFNELTRLLRTKGVIGFLDRTNMAGFSFRTADLDPLREFYFEWNAPEKEFINPELEAIRKVLWSRTEEYYELIQTNTFVAGRSDFQTIPPEWEEQNSEHFWRVVKALHSLAKDIVAIHAQLVRAGRSQLLR